MLRVKSPRLLNLIVPSNTQWLCKIQSLLSMVYRWEDRPLLLRNLPLAIQQFLDTHGTLGIHGSKVFSQPSELLIPDDVQNQAGWAATCGKSQILFSKWLLRSLPKGGIPDHFLRFCFEMGLVFLAPALECRADSPWPWPARPLCFVQAPVGLAPVTIPALSAEGSIQGRPETHPHPISSTFWAQACVNQSSWFSSGSTAEAQRKGGCHLLSVC